MKKLKYKEIEGHYYHCLDCGEFYRIVNGRRVHQPMAKYALTSSLNFRTVDKKEHRCRKELHSQIVHGAKKKVKTMRVLV